MDARRKLAAIAGCASKALNPLQAGSDMQTIVQQFSLILYAASADGAVRTSARLLIKLAAAGGAELLQELLVVIVVIVVVLVFACVLSRQPAAAPAAAAAAAAAAARQGLGSHPAPAGGEPAAKLVRSR